MIEDFHFLRPWWLLALLPLAYVVWLLLKFRFDSSGWRNVVDTALMPFVLTSGETVRRRWPLGLLALVGVIVIFALAGPVWERQAQPVYQTKSSLVILLDLSRSMDAADLRPSRLIRARHKIVDLLKRRGEGQTALVVYAGDAFTVTPLTDDVDTILSLLASLETNIMPAQGSRVDRALQLAFELLRNGGIASGDILLLSDGVSPQEVEQIDAMWQAEAQHRLSVLAVGTREGGPIPMRSGGFLKDRDGSIVIAGLNESELRDLAALGEGVYVSLTTNDVDVDAITGLLESAPGIGDSERFDGSADIWRELGPGLLLLALPLAALGFRRGLLWSLPLCLLLPPLEARAFEWRDLWRNADQYAGELFEQGEHAEAARLFNDPAWSASSYFRSGDYESAQELWQQLDDETAHYNRGNALAKLGRYEQAIEAYDEALRQDPQHADALHNKKQVEEWLRNQAQPESEQNEQQQSGEQQAESQSQSQEGGQSQDNEDQAQQSPGQQSDSEGEESDLADALEPAQDSPGSDDSGQEEASLASLEEQMSAQAAEQWLRKIPDDPGGLLRRKFLYQYRKRGGVDTESESW